MPSSGLRDDGRVVFRAKDLGREEVLEAAPTLPEAELLLHRGVYERMVRDYNGGRPIAATVTTTVDAPMGSGLGSSSALVVALLDAFRVLVGAPLGQYDLARLAFQTERIDLALPGGKQDQYAAAFGGTNFIEFLSRDRVIVNPLRFSESTKNELEASLVVCFSGSARDASGIIERQTAGMTRHEACALRAMHSLRGDAFEMKKALLLGDIREMARILEASWAAKKQTATRDLERPASSGSTTSRAPTARSPARSRGRAAAAS